MSQKRRMIKMGEGNRNEREERDYFSRLMFGDRTNSEESNESTDRDTDEGEKANRDKAWEDDRSEERNWLFRPRERREPFQQKNRMDELFSLGGTNRKRSNPSVLDLLENVDYVELMEHFDTLMTSANKLKPLMNKLKPILGTILNKK